MILTAYNPGVKFGSQKPLFSDHKENNFSRVNKPDVLDNRSIAYRYVHESSEIDYEKFKTDFQGFTGKKFDGDYSKLAEIPIPGISDKYGVHLDNYMIGFAHLLVVPKENRYSFAECQKKDGEDFRVTVDKTLKTLRKMYPNRNIYFAEHGSGYFEEGKQSHSGTSLSTAHAHGHFLIPYKHRQPDFDKHMLPLLNLNLRCNGWKNSEKHLYVSDKLIPDYQKAYEEVSGKLGADVNKHPYLQIGIDKPDGKQKSALFIEKSDKDKVPSQILRFFYHHFLKKTDSTTNHRIHWDWKHTMKHINTPPEKDVNSMAAKLNSTFRKGNMVRFWSRFMECCKKTKD